MKPELASYSAEDVGTVSMSVLEVYRLTWTATQFGLGRRQLEAFSGNLERHSERAGFRLRVAREPAARSVVGFAYGYKSERGGWWRDVVVRAMGERLARQWFLDAFEFAELAVLPDHQGRGIGMQLHDALLEGLTNRTAVLSTQRANHRARNLYLRAGWQVVLDRLVFPGRSYPYSVMGLDLAARGAEESGESDPDTA